MPTSMTFGFLLAGVINIGCVLLFTQGFTSHAVGHRFPEVCDDFGMVCIMLWGAAYIAVARRVDQVPAIALVFAMEKLVYVATWVYFLRHNDLGSLWQGDQSVALFYTLYGPNDLLFCLFFAWSWWKLRRA